MTMTDLDFLSYADVHRVVVETIPAIRRLSISAVSFVPRGGGVIAGIIAQLLDLPLIEAAELAQMPPGRCLLVDDMIVTGRSLAAFRRRFLPDYRAVPTYVFAAVPSERLPGAEVDLVSITVDPARYFLLPWEIGDIFRPIFPFPTLVDLDGVIRAPGDPARALLTTPHVIAHLVCFGGTEAAAVQWLAEHGYRYQRLTCLADPEDSEGLAEIIQENAVRLYLTGDARRGRAVRARCPSCHVIAFPEMIELDAVGHRIDTSSPGPG